MKTTKNWSKVLLAGMAAMVLSFGLVLAGCDDGSKDDPPCCTADTWKSISSGEEMPSAAEIAKLPVCCQTSYSKILQLVMTFTDPTEAQLKEAAGCCYDSMKSAGAFDN